MNSYPTSTQHKLRVSYLLNPSGTDGQLRDAAEQAPSNAPHLFHSTPSSSTTMTTSSSKDKRSRRFGCHRCLYRFRTRGDFQKHFDTVHLGIRNHICQTCGARFGERGNLTKHEKRHAGLRVFKCLVPFCEKSFVLRDGLSRHERLVHKFDSRDSALLQKMHHTGEGLDMIHRMQPSNGHIRIVN